MTRLLALLLLLISATVLSGCGIRGELKTPPPVWGADKTDNTDDVAAEDVATRDDPSDLTEEEDPGYGIQVVDQP